MNHRINSIFQLKVCTQGGDESIRIINPDDINTPSGYFVEVFAFGLNSPINMVFSENGALYIMESGYESGNPRVLRLRNGIFDLVADQFIAPGAGINVLDGNIYVSHKGRITRIDSNGTRQDIVTGLPCNGDFGISNVAFGPDGRLYFGLGTATNSGVVGQDNQWVLDHPLLHDKPPYDTILLGQNYESDNIFISSRERIYTGAFSSYGEPNTPLEIKKGIVKASGSILSVNRDGSDMELVAWGFRNPLRVEFDRNYQLFAVNRGYDVRGSRPIANAPDELWLVIPGLWYGWPDYSAGEPLTLSKFRPEGGLQPQFLFTTHPNIPPTPYAVFPPHTSIMGFDFNYNAEFGPYGDVYIAEYGTLGPATMGESAPFNGIGHNISKIDMNTGDVSTFINNKSGLPAYIDRGGGFGRPVDIKFGPDGAMYILDMGITSQDLIDRVVPNTGVIWRVTRSL